MEWTILNFYVQQKVPLLSLSALSDLRRVSFVAGKVSYGCYGVETRT